MGHVDTEDIILVDVTHLKVPDQDALVHQVHHPNSRPIPILAYSNNKVAPDMSIDHLVPSVVLLAEDDQAG